MIFNVYKTDELETSTLGEIAQIKDTCWTHGVPSQIRWIEENCLSNDQHILMRDDKECLIGYCAITKVKVRLDGERAVFSGLGGVCISHQQQGKGFGSMLVDYATDLIECSSTSGILLCREALRSFYALHGWKELPFDDAYIGGQKYGAHIMTLGKVPERCCSALVDRNF